MKITNFPQGLDSKLNLPDIDKDDRMNDAVVEHDVQHTLLNQAVIELQKKVGADESEDEESIDYRLRDIEEHGSGGAGLELSDESADLNDPPDVWLSAVIGGVEYIVPGYMTKEVPPPDDIEAGNAMLLYPTGVKAHEYIPFTGEE